MATQILSIFELLDNFFGSEHCPNAQLLNNRQIRELHDHTLRFYQAFDFAASNNYKTQIYLGSFLSSPPLSIETSPYLASALLCTDSVVLFDPLHYWFCEEQYQRERLISAPTGWRNLDSNSQDFKRPDYKKTKQYLTHTFPWLYGLRSLVDTGKIILIPTEQIVYSNLSKLKEVVKEIQNLAAPLEDLTREFPPEEITVDDNRKGFFTFAGGDRVIQIRKAITRGIELFAKDMIIANTTGALYTAPFRWEERLGKISFNEYAAIKYQTNIVEGIRNLRLPILSNLSPDILAKIHQDSGYSEFRTGLNEMLRHIDAEIGSQDFINRVIEIERDILLPKIEGIHKEVHSSNFKRLTNALQEGFMTFGQTFGGNLASGVDLESNVKASGIAGGFSVLLGMIKKRVTSSDKRIWLQLLPEKPSLPIYGSPLTLKRQSGSSNGWEIDDKPSLKVNLTAAVLKFPWKMDEPSAQSQASKEE